jgi:hypothetical protein
MSIGLGATSGNVRGPSRKVVKPGQIASYTRSTSSGVNDSSSSFVDASSSKTSSSTSAKAVRNSAGGNESTRARHRSLRSAHPKSCAPMSGAAAATVSGAAAAASHAYMPPKEIPLTPTRLASTFTKTTRGSFEDASFASEAGATRDASARPSAANRTARRQSHAPSNRKGRAEPE